jgi:DegV family protein with EDD domain
MIKIISDTLSGIPVDQAKSLGIYYLPQIIIFGENTYRDDTEMDSNMFLEKLVICPSNELSGTFRSATVAAQDFGNADIRVIDTRTIGASLGSIVLATLEWVKQGLDADTIVEMIKEMALREKTYFVVDTLEYLHKGGRIGGAQALFGSILQVKPILTLVDGRTEAAESQRTKRRAIGRLCEFVMTQCPHDTSSYLAVQHGGAEEEANHLADEFSQSLGIKNVRVVNLPPAILTHAGPKALSASFFLKKTS